MKLLFVVFHGIDGGHSGINKKIKSQLKSFNKIMGKTYLSYLQTDINNQYDRRMIDENVLEEYSSSFVIPKRFQWRLRFQHLIEFILKEKINTVVLRYTHFANPFFTKFLKELKHNGVYIIMEIPTYPYDKEYVDSHLPLKVIKTVETHYRKTFRLYVDLMLTFSNEKRIFGVNTLKIDNGIDIEEIPVKLKSKISSEVHLIAVASMSFWHGYDRIIEGLNIFYNSSPLPSKKVYLHLVGNTENPESLKYQKLVRLYNLSEYVIFHGYKTGDELNSLFDSAHLALGCLGVHRKGIINIKSLKNAEYCARGIPFVYSEVDDSFENKSFILKVNPDDSPIDINSLIKFSLSQDDTPIKIRDYAIKHLTWDVQIQKIKKAYLLEKSS